jgi:DNA-binding NtrC family response regulator
MAKTVTDVLCVGLDGAAMQTRRLVLEKAGLNVSQARDIRQVQAACESNSFAVVILGHSLNPNEKKRVSDVVLTYCKTAKLLELHRAIVPDLPSADGHLQANPTEPGVLVEAVSRLLKKRRKTKAQST